MGEFVLNWISFRKSFLLLDRIKRVKHHLSHRCMAVLQSRSCHSIDREIHCSQSSHRSPQSWIRSPLLISSSHKLASLRSTSGNSPNFDPWPDRSIVFYWWPCVGKQGVVLLRSWCWPVLLDFLDKVSPHQTMTVPCCKLGSRNHSGTASQQGKSDLFDGIVFPLLVSV